MAIFDDPPQPPLSAEATGHDGSTNVDRGAADDEVSLVDLLIVLGEQKKLLFGLPAIASVIAIGVSLLLPVYFTASTTFLPPQQQQNAALDALKQMGGLAGVNVAGLKRPEDLYIAVIKSETVQNSLIDRFDLMQRYGARYRQQARSILSGNVDIVAEKSGLLRLEFTDKEPVFAAELANANVDELRKRLASLAVTEAQQRRAFFEHQLLNSKEALIKVEVALKQTQERTGLIALDRQGEVIIKAAADLRAQIVSREVQLQMMRNYATGQNPDVQRIESEIAGFRAQLTKSEGGAARGQGDVIVAIDKVPEAGLAYIRAVREVKYQETLFELLARQLEVAKLDEAREGPMVQQMDVASPPELKSRPKRLEIVVAVGILSGLAAVFLIMVLATVRRFRGDPVRLSQFETLRSAWRIRSRP